jgi:hypothetical protein
MLPANGLVRRNCTMNRNDLHLFSQQGVTQCSKRQRRPKTNSFRSESFPSRKCCYPLTDRLMSPGVPPVFKGNF